MNTQRQITILTITHVIRAFMITMPVIVIYWQEHGLSIRDIFVLQVIFSLVIVVFEVPSGYFADRWGRKLSIILGLVGGAVGFLFFWLYPGFVGFMLGEMAMGLGASLLSGSKDALLYETLLEDKNESNYSKIQGRQFALGNVSEAIASLTGTGLAVAVSLEAVFFWQWIIFGLGIPLTFFLIEPKVHKETETPHIMSTLKEFASGKRYLLYLSLLSGGLSAATLSMVWFTQPYWRSLGIDLAHFGYLWAGLQLCVGLGAISAYRLEQKLRFRTLFSGLAITPIILYGALALTKPVWLIMSIIPFFWVIRGIAQPIIRDYVNRECRNSNRATMLSLNALTARLIFSVSSPFLGWTVDIWSFQTAFLLSAVMYGAITLGGYILLRTAH